MKIGGYLVVMVYGSFGVLHPNKSIFITLSLTITVSSLTLSMLQAGMEVGLSSPRVVTPFWSKEMLSRPLTLRLGVKI